jgi:hypothetical protein
MNLNKYSVGSYYRQIEALKNVKALEFTHQREFLADIVSTLKSVWI